MTDRPVRQINAFTLQAAPANGDFLLIQEAAGNLYKKTTLQNVIAAVGIVVDLTPQLGGDLDGNGFDIVLSNNSEYQIKDSGGTERRIAHVSAANQINLGAIDVSWGGLTVINAGTGMTFQVDGASGSKTRAMDIQTDGDIGVGIVVPLARFHIDQSSTVGAKPVLILDQADVDEPAIKFIGSSDDATADRTLVDAVDFTTPGAIVAWLMIEIQDDQGTNPIADGIYYMPIHAIPTA